MKTSTTFELARKAALNAVEAALRRSRNCTLPKAKAAQTFTTSLETLFPINCLSTSLLLHPPPFLLTRICKQIKLDTGDKIYADSNS